MGAILVRVGNAMRQPLDDQMDVSVVSARTDTTVAMASNVSGQAAVRFERLTEGQPYVIKVFPMRHRPVRAVYVSRARRQSGAGAPLLPAAP